MVLGRYGSRCDADYVELRSGLYSYSSLIGRYCGSFPPIFAQYSSGRYMWVKFHSDQRITMRGFFASYEAVDFEERDNCKLLLLLLEFERKYVFIYTFQII